MLPLDFHQWMPATQAVSIALLTFVQEDVPTVSAALLASAGTLSWQVGWLASFLGIWVGDALLYLAARLLGRPLLDKPWFRRFCDPRAVADSERWFARKGTVLLLTSRFLPGTRLPTYLAAGFLRLPFGRFLLVTGAAVAAWTIAIFLLVRSFGAGLLTWFGLWNFWTILFLAVGLALTIRLLAGSRLSRWEFWPAWLFYIPVAANYLRLAIRYRSLTLPSAANPGMFSGGLVGESKIATLRELQQTSPEFTAEAHPLRCPPPFDYPFIVKPDVGQRGVGVKLIRTSEHLQEYLRQAGAASVVQRYVPGPREVGIFYYRFPHERHGHILAITEKIFPSITGDGEHTIEELVRRDPRARFLAKKYLQRLAGRRHKVLLPGETVRLVETGNHAQGCIFRDGSHLWSEKLEARIDQISQRLNGFFVGRYDIRYGSDEDLRSGQNFQIIELNGAASEATNIYDARNSLLSAYRALFRQWQLVFAIAAANRELGWPPMHPALLWRKWRETMKLVASYPPSD